MMRPGSFTIKHFFKPALLSSNKSVFELLAFCYQQQHNNTTSSRRVFHSNTDRPEPEATSRPQISYWSLSSLRAADTYFQNTFTPLRFLWGKRLTSAPADTFWQNRLSWKRVKCRDTSYVSVHRFHSTVLFCPYLALFYSNMLTSVVTTPAVTVLSAGQLACGATVAVSSVSSAASGPIADVWVGTAVNI